MTRCGRTATVGADGAAVRTAVHIGLPKTGTSTLQQLVFARHPEVAYFGQSNIWTSDATKQVLKALLVDTDQIGDESHAAAKAVIREALASRPKVVISDEALSCGQFMLRANSWKITTDHAEVARRIWSVLGDVEIIVVLRNQADWLESWYRQGLKSGKYEAMDFSVWFNDELGTRREALLDLLHFDHLYDAYVRVFGTERVHFFLYERYWNDYPSLAGEIARCIGVDAGTAVRLARDTPRNVTGTHFESLPAAMKRVTRMAPFRTLLDHVPRRLKNSVHRVLRTRRRFPAMSSADKAAQMKCFAASNRALFERLGLDGRGLGYY